MRRLLQRVMLLVRLRAEMDQGKGFDAAAQALFVRLPFAARAALARQAQAWSSAELDQTLAGVARRGGADPARSGLGRRDGDASALVHGFGTMIASAARTDFGLTSIMT